MYGATAFFFSPSLLYHRQQSVYLGVNVAMVTTFTDESTPPVNGDTDYLSLPSELPMSGGLGGAGGRRSSAKFSTCLPKCTSGGLGGTGATC